jgi:hypothetical protein
MFAPFLGVGIAQNPDLHSQSRIVHRGSANKECAYGNLSAFDDRRVSLSDVSNRIVAVNVEKTAVPFKSTGEIPGPARGNAMTEEYVQMVGQDGLPLGLAIGQFTQPPRVLQQSTDARTPRRPLARRSIG